MPEAVNNFPQELTPFIGRQDEISVVTRLLHNPDCRPITLVGPGGIGKTRLAVQAAHEVARDFERGAYFIELEPVRSGNHMISTIADIKNIPLSGPDELVFRPI